MTVLNHCIANQIDRVELIGTDPSPKMLEIAKIRLQENFETNGSIRFCTADECSKENAYDIILSSLVVIYAPDQSQMLKDFHRQIRGNGLLIDSHWSHYSQVAFLSVLKRVGIFMATGKRINPSELESDASFSLWSEEKTRELFTTQGFIIQQWITVDLPMSFPNIRMFLSFCRIAPWFNDPIQYSVAEVEVQRILREEYHLTIQSNDSFELPSKVVVIVASK